MDFILLFPLLEISGKRDLVILNSVISLFEPIKMRDLTIISSVYSRHFQIQPILL